MVKWKIAFKYIKLGNKYYTYIGNFLKFNAWIGDICCKNSAIIADPALMVIIICFLCAI